MYAPNGVARIWGGHPADATRYFFRHLRLPTGFSGGGGISRNFPGSPCADQIQWGGRSRNFSAFLAEIFRYLTDQSNFINSGTFFYISGPPQRNNINSLQKKNILQKFGGGPWPPWPPWLRHCMHHNHFKFHQTFFLQTWIHDTMLV